MISDKKDMVKEEYVTYETAQLLCEKGFEVDPERDYWKIGKDGTRYKISRFGAYTSDISNESAFYVPKDSYPCPTQQVASRWLREERDIMIEVLLEGQGNGYYTHIKKPSTGESIDILPTIYYYYEQAYEAAIKYCLDKLCKED